MNILAFDTGLNKTYLALSINDEIFSQTIVSDEEKYHSAYLIKKIVELLDAHSLTTRDLDVITTNIGPGSFTGIRVGLTVARVLAQGINADCVGVNSLELISTQYGLPAITILDARKNKAYVGFDEKVDLVDLDNLPELLNEFEGKIIADTKMQKYLSDFNISSVNFEEEDLDYGKTLIEITKNRYASGAITKWQGLKPLYIQPPPIHEKVAKKLNV